MTLAGPLTVEYARQAGVDPSSLPTKIAQLLTSDPSLPVPPATDRDTWDLHAGTLEPATVRALLDVAVAERGSAWPLPLAHDAARVHRDGNRDAWESAAFARQRRVSRAAVAAAVTLHDDWLDELADGLWLLCEQSSWCWPAHDEVFARHGAVLADVDEPVLDLGAGEVAGQLAWIDHLLGDQLDERFPGLRTRLARETRRRVLDPFVARRDWHWLGLDGDVHNWNPWIHGNVLIAALQFTVDRDELAAIVSLVVDGIDRYVAALPPDGAIDEGYGYWWNGACRALEALDILAFATGGLLDATAIPALRATVAFPHRMHLGGEWYVNFADSEAHPSPIDRPWHELHRAARAVGDAEAMAYAAAHRIVDGPVATEAAGLGRLLRGLTDSAWAAVTPRPAPLPFDVWLPSVEVLVARTAAGTASGLTLAAKGGHNGEHHNHNDVGSFLVASDGVPVLVDAGRPTYTAATFGPDRYSIWTMQSTWHNVPEVRGTAQAAGAESRARSVTTDVGPDGVALSLELAAAYPVPALRSWHRTVHLERGQRARVVLEDDWSLEPWSGPDDEPATIVRLLIAGEVRLTPGEAHITPGQGVTPVIVRWDAGATARLVSKPLDDPLLVSAWGSTLHRLDIDVTSRTNLRVTVDLDPLTSGDES